MCHMIDNFSLLFTYPDACKGICRPRKGSNRNLARSEAATRGYASSTWMTYRQATVLGGQVRKGEQGTTVVYANVIERSDKLGQADSTGADQIATMRIPVLRAYTVFNVDQIDGLPGTATSQLLALASLPGRIERTDAFITASGATVVHRGSRACYIMTTRGLRANDGVPGLLKITDIGES